MRTQTLRVLLPGGLMLAALASISCENSDPVAIEGSQIILTASPNPVNLTLVPSGQSTVQARVTTSSGVPQEGVLVFFNTTNGTVSPPGSDTTDSDGLAFTTFASFTPTTATLTARSGGVIATLTIQVLGDTATSHVLSTSDAVVDTVCTDPIQMTGTVLGSSGAISGAQVTFEFLGASPGTLTGTFNPTSAVTNSSGTYTVSFTLNPTQCNSSCLGAPACSINVRALAAGLNSNQVPITDNL